MSQFYGGAQFATMGAGTRQLVFGMPRVQRVQVTSGSAILQLPSALTCRLGGPVFYVVNDASSSFAVPIRDGAGGTLVASLGVGGWAKVWCLGNTTIAGKWRIATGTLNTPATVYQKPRTSDIKSLPALCPQAMARYMLINCTAPAEVVYSADPALEPAVGRVIKVVIGSGPSFKCWFVYRIRLSGVFPEAAVPAFTILDSCRECLMTSPAGGNGSGGGSSGGDTGFDGDDSGVDSTSYTRKTYRGSGSTVFGS
jgi:hypothetical protein